MGDQDFSRVLGVSVPFGSEAVALRGSARDSPDENAQEQAWSQTRGSRL